tara:strand:+ start:24980 stop:25738 length:759 start_codon:yes stop_codon:yes gene_type:complete
MDFLTSPLLLHPALKHGFFTRQGGVSSGIYASLNCGPGSQDAPENVTENRRRVCEALGAEELSGIYQIHSATVRTLESPWVTPPQADALVTRRKNIAISVLTADCCPVLLAAPEAGVIGAAHAGWKGALEGILENTVQEMCRLGAARETIRAAIGPCIAQNAYETGPEFYAAVMERDPAAHRFFRPASRPDHSFFDLAGFVKHRLQTAGLEHIDHLERDTYGEQDLFFSYRRTTHRRETDYGRQISAIMICS